MVTDPNIILAGNQMAQPRLPDVNAMMQTRTAGLENIYEIETGRQEQAAQAAQEAATAQEDATFKALLPAYTYGIQTGDIAGALNLVPPEMQESLAPYVDALTGKSPQEVQAALIGSLSSDPRGQEALSAIQRGQTFGVQDRQQKLAELNYEQELAAAGQPKPMSTFEEVQSGFREREVALKEEEAKAKAAREGAIAAGEAPPTELKKGERWNAKTGRVEAVPGSETYTKQKSTQAKDYSSAKNAVRELEKVRGTVKALKETTGYQKAMGTGAIMSNVPNTPLSTFTGAYDFQTKYKNLKGAVATLGRAAASLQGKLGNMAVQEWKNVSDAIANLDLASMSSAQLDDQLAIITNDLTALDAQVRDAYEKEWGDTQFYNPLEGEGPAEPPPSADRPAGVGADWSLEEDAQGNRAWVNPQRNKFIEAK
tara:strand:+ start:8579 stop:9856 length:1278 start_codon:yes stop_codon:yes gene_type:complete